MSKSPRKNFNASDDFIKLIITSYIMTAAMEYLKMDSLTDSPSEEVIHSPSEIWTLPLEERKALLMKICGDIVESFISFEYHSTYLLLETDGAMRVLVAETILLVRSYTGD